MPPIAMASISARALRKVHCTAAIRLPIASAAVPTAMQAMRRGSMAQQITWVSTPRGRRSSVSSCPERTMEGKDPVTPRPKHSVR